MTWSAGLQDQEVLPFPMAIACLFRIVNFMLCRLKEKLKTSTSSSKSTCLVFYVLGIDVHTYQYVVCAFDPCV